MATTKRLDIQGMRAIAVLLVVIYHLWPTALPGGYIGVDIFFVISGFLITAHMLGEVDRTGTISLTKFWARRIKRLLPASFLVLGVSLILSLTLMYGVTTKQNIAEISASALYVVNWVLAADAVDYLAAENSPSLVQHFWSLSVEEQFYIVWPIIVVLTVAAALKLKKNRRRSVFVVLTVIFIASFAASIWLTLTEPAIAYFATYVRAWEFALGGLLAFLARTPLASRPQVAAAVSWVAVAAIIGSAVCFTSDTLFPGWMAAIPVFAVGALIAVGDVDAPWAPQRLTHNTAVQFFGDTSYSLYLWHWPLIVAFPWLVGGEIGIVQGLVIFVVAVLLAGLTKRFVEDPFRGPRSPIRLRRMAYPFMAAGAATVLVVGVAGQQAIDRTIASDRSSVERWMTEAESCFGAYAIDNGCVDLYAVTDTVTPAFTATDNFDFRGAIRQAEEVTGASGAEYYVLGETQNPTRTIALLGDSHSEHLREAFDVAGKRLGWRVYAIGEGDAAPSGCGSNWTLQRRKHRATSVLRGATRPAPR